MNDTSDPDIVLIGAGIMSATLGILLKELNPNLKLLWKAFDLDV